MWLYPEGWVRTWEPTTDSSSAEPLRGEKVVENEEAGRRQPPGKGGAQGPPRRGADLWLPTLTGTVAGPALGSACRNSPNPHSKPMRQILSLRPTWDTDSSAGRPLWSDANAEMVLWEPRSPAHYTQSSPIHSPPYARLPGPPEECLRISVSFRRSSPFSVFRPTPKWLTKSFPFIQVWLSVFRSVCWMIFV